MFGKNKIPILIMILGVLFLGCGVSLALTSNYYTVTFNFNNGSNGKTYKIKANKTVPSFDNPTREGYDFVEWKYQGRKYDFSMKVNSNMTIDAIWAKQGIDSDVVTFTVFFDSDGGSSVASQIIEEGKFAVEPFVPTKFGYKFIEWQLDGVKYQFGSKVKEDIKLKAIWEKEEIYYKVTFDTDGGNVIDRVEVLAGQPVSVPTTPVKEGYTFVEWQLNNKKYDFSKKIDSDITLKASWKAVSSDVTPTPTVAPTPNNSQSDNNTQRAKYTVTFNSNGGSNVASQVVEDGSVVSKPANPTRSGYTFVEWQLNGSTYSFFTKVNKNITLVAVWKANATPTSTPTAKPTATPTVAPIVKPTPTAKPTPTPTAKPTPTPTAKPTPTPTAKPTPTPTAKPTPTPTAKPTPTPTAKPTPTPTAVPKTYTITKSKVDEYAPDINLTVYEDGTAISVKGLKYSDGVKLNATISGTKITIGKYDLDSSDTSLIVILSNGSEVTAKFV